MNRWAWIVVSLYVLIILALTCPVLIGAFAPMSRGDMAGFGKAYLFWPYWVWLVVMALAQAALLMVPVRVTSRRPVTRRPIFALVAASGLMMGFLVIGATFALFEFFTGERMAQHDWILWWCFLAAGLVWMGWAFIFYRRGRAMDPMDLIARQRGLMIRGSVLELLVAVPTHIVARWRGYCCAGFYTFVGIAAGLSVMLFAFGPGIYFLYLARWRRLHPEAQTNPASAPDDAKETEIE